MYVMETIFDHNMTEEERKAIIGDMTKEWYLKVLDEVSSNLLIAKLYLLRGDEKKKMEYVNKLPVRMKYDFLRMYGPYD